jgi:hypothetical protein
VEPIFDRALYPFEDGTVVYDASVGALRQWTIR